MTLPVRRKDDDAHETETEGQTRKLSSTRRGIRRESSRKEALEVDADAGGVEEGTTTLDGWQDLNRQLHQRRGLQKSLHTAAAEAGEGEGEDGAISNMPGFHQDLPLVAASLAGS